MINLPRRMTCWVAVGAITLCIARPAVALRKNQPWSRKTKAQPDAQAGGWFINLGITGARAKILIDAPKALEVAYVFKGTPAFGKLKIGDKIVAANGKPFTRVHKFGYGVTYFGYEGPMMDFGNALEESQGKLGGKLTLSVVRGDAKVEVEISLPKKYGSFSKTYPYNCTKTDVILAQLYSYLLKKQRPDGSWHGRPHINAFAALALLGSGNKAHLVKSKN